MSQADSEALRELAATFQVELLGQGDPHLGINLLATMAGVLADLAPADGTILTKDGRTAHLGINLLVTGAASTGLVLDEVLTELGRRQTNLWHHLSRYGTHIEEQRRKLGASLPPMDPKAGAPEDRMAETQHELEPLLNTRAEGWSRIFNTPPEEDIAALVTRPKFLVSVPNPGEFTSQLRGLRPGHTLVHAGCSRPADLVAMAEPVTAFIEGRRPLGNGCESAGGHLLLTDPLQKLHSYAQEAGDDSAWLGHFLWLCDGEAGPEAPVSEQAADGPETITTRFRMALDNILAQRMNLPEKEPFRLPLNTRQAKVRFREFLDGMEPRLPGISMAARNLIDSLAFGLNRIASISRLNPRSYDAAHPFSQEPVEGFEDPLPLTTSGVEALARFLVRRMANARMAMMHHSELARRRSQIQRIFQKLQQGPMSTRQIYKGLNKLLAEDCRECLEWMVKANIARKRGREWELVEGARLRFEDCSTPILEL